jgi:hypothetical protein
MARALAARDGAGVNLRMAFVIDGTNYPSPREKSLIAAEKFARTLRIHATDGTLGDVSAHCFR